jgi:hypothetical protein
MARAEPNVEFVEGIHIDAICGRLLSAAKKLPGRIRLFDFNPDNPMAQLYAMVLVADRSTAMVGSANLSFHGMVANHELALVVRGPIAEEIAARARQLFCVNGRSFPCAAGDSGRWESGNPAFGFPLSHRPQFFFAFDSCA